MRPSIAIFVYKYIIYLFIYIFSLRLWLSGTITCRKARGPGFEPRYLLIRVFVNNLINNNTNNTHFTNCIVLF